MASLPLVAGRAPAQSWINPAGGNWSVGANWTAAPVSGATTSLTFGSAATLTSTYTATNDIGAFNLNAITFDNTAGGATVAGAMLNFTGTGPTITNSGTVAANISAPLNFSAITTIGGAGNLNLSGALSSPNSATPGALVMNGTGVLALTGGGTLNDGTTASTGGYLSVTNGTVNVTAGVYSLNYAGTGNSLAGLQVNSLTTTTTANFNISGAATLSSPVIFIGRLASSNAAASVSGTGTTLTSTGQFSVASRAGAIASLSITNGGLASGGSFSSGLTETAIGTTTVSGVDSSGNPSTLNDGTNMVLGGGAGVAGGSGIVNVLSGGLATTTGFVALGFQGANSSGTILVNGVSAGATPHASTLNVGAQLNIGGGSGVAPPGSGTVTASGGGQINVVTNLVMNSDSGGTATSTLTVTGAGSQVTVGGNGAVGLASGTANFNVLAGGAATMNSSVFVGINPGASGVVTVNGAGSQLTVVGQMTLSGGNGTGTGGTATLKVQAGGTVTANTNGTTVTLLGQDAGTTTVTVDGIGSTLSVSQVQMVSGTMNVTVQNGGSFVSSDTLFTAINPGSIANVTITGAGSTLTAAGGAVIGGGNTAGGTGTLSAANGGAVSLPGGLELFGGGTANVNAGGTMTVGGLFDGVTGSSVGAVNVAAGTTLTINLGGGSFSGTIAGFGSVTMNASDGGTQILAGPNTYSGGTVVLNGTISVASDANLGTGNVTGASLGTVLFTGTTATTKSFNMNGGTVSVASGQTLTFNGSQVVGGFLDGSGTFATNATNGAQFVNMTSTQSVAVSSNSSADRFSHFSNGGQLNVAANLNFGAATTFNGVVNQGSGTISIGANSLLNASNFQSYGEIDLAPGSRSTGSSGVTQIKNVGTASLFFDSGSRTFIATIATASTFSAGFDLNGQSAVVSDGLFVNNGYVIDSSNGGFGTNTVIADFGALVKGAGFFQNSPITRNGGRVQAGNSPGAASFGQFVFGPGGVSNYVFAIDNAAGVAGPTADANGQVSGWGLLKAVRQAIGSATTGGNFVWTANANNKLTVSLETLVNPTTAGTDPNGLMANFDPTKSYSWPAVEWSGVYTGPTTVAALDAATTFDTSEFANPVAGSFGWSLDPAAQTLSLTYTPSAVPEPGTLALLLVAVLPPVIRRGFNRRRVTERHN